MSSRPLRARDLNSEGVFVRKATGLVREVGLGSSILWCLMFAAQIQTMAFLMPYYWQYGDFAGNLWLGIGIGFLVIFLINSVYAHFSSAMPRSGGDYVFLGRTIHQLAGFGPNLVFSFGMIWWSASNMVFISFLLQTFLSLFYSQQALAPLQTAWGSFGLGLVLWVFVALLTLGKLGLFLKVNIVAWILQFIIMGIVAYYIISAAGHFPQLFNAWSLKYVPSNPDMYHSIINNATSSGFQINPPPEGWVMSRTLAWSSAIVGFYLPFTAGIVWIAGEVKRAENGLRQHIAMEVAAVLCLIVLIVMGVSWVYTVDPRFMGAFASLGSVPGLPVNSYYWSFFPAIMPSWVVATFLMVALLAQISVTYQNMVVFSRNLFAWSFDRLVPSLFSRLGERNRQPTVALATALGLMLAAGAVAFSLNIFTYLAALFLLILVNLFILCLSGVVFPYIRKDMFEQMPLKRRIGGVPVLSIISLIALVLLAWVITPYFTNPDYVASYGVTLPSIGVSVLIWSLAFVIYFASRAYNKRRGIDLDKIFSQIPPA
jgi:basic amino acid/polyamine antiporter, APA family